MIYFDVRFKVFILEGSSLENVNRCLSTQDDVALQSNLTRRMVNDCLNGWNGEK